MRIGTRYPSSNLPDHVDVVVIGSGIGGLATASLLARRSRRVLVLERHYTVGGFTHTYRRRGYEWDVGVHYIGSVQHRSSPVRRAFDALTDGQLRWAPMDDVYDRVIVADRSYDFVAGEANFRESLLSRFPRARQQIDSYLQAIRAGSRNLMAEFAPRSLPGPLSGLRLPGRGAFGRTTEQVLRPIISDPQLYGVLTAQWGDYGLPPQRSSFGMHALVAEHYLGGASYPVGGSSRIAATIVPGIERAGGAVLTDAEVGQILVHDGRAIGVRMADGAEIHADHVVSSAGAHVTFGRLLDPQLAAGLPLARRVAALRPTSGHLGLTIGLRGDPAEFDLPRSNLWVYPGYDHDAAVQRSSESPHAELPVNYISFPSAKDPSWSERFPGRATIEVISMAPYEWFAAWADRPWRQRGAEYEALKQDLTGRMLDVVAAHVPGVRGRIDYCELSTPLSTRTFGGYPHGEMYGLEHSPRRFAERGLAARTPIRGLWLTGQDTLTCGVTSAMMSGVLTAGALLGPAAAPLFAEVFGVTHRT